METRAASSCRRVALSALRAVFTTASEFVASAALSTLHRRVAGSLVSMIFGTCADSTSTTRQRGCATCAESRSTRCTRQSRRCRSRSPGPRQTCLTLLSRRATRCDVVRTKAPAAARMHCTLVMLALAGHGMLMTCTTFWWRVTLSSGTRYGASPLCCSLL